jgi:hypothetical protein
MSLERLNLRIRTRVGVAAVAIGGLVASALAASATGASAAPVGSRDSGGGPVVATANGPVRGVSTGGGR